MLRERKNKYCEADNTICRAKNKIMFMGGQVHIARERERERRPIVLYAGQNHKIAFISASEAFQR